MSIQKIVVQLIGFREVFHPEYCDHLIRLLYTFDSKLYEFQEYEWNGDVHAPLPDISVVAIAGSDSLKSLIAKFLQCRSIRVLTVGSECVFEDFQQMGLHMWPAGLITKVVSSSVEMRQPFGSFVPQNNSPLTIPGSLAS